VGQEFLKYVNYVLRRLWIVLLLAALAGGAVYWYLGRQAPTYRSEAKVFIGNAITSPNPNPSEVSLARSLVSTYIELAETRNILQGTLDDLGLDGVISINRLKSMVSARQVLETSILIIRVTDSQRERARDIANTIVQKLIEGSPTTLTPEEQRQLNVLQGQIDAIQEQITTRSVEAIRIGAALDEATTANNQREILTLTEQYNRIIDQLDTARGNLAQFTNTYLDLSNRVNRLTLVEEGQLPVRSLNVNRNLVTILVVFIVIGMTIGGLLLYLEYIDGKIRTENEVQKWLQVPVLGLIKRVKKTSEKAQNYLVAHNPRSPMFEGYRQVMSKLLFSGERPQSLSNIYLVVSPDKREGRSFSAANLAVIMAEAGIKTLLIDGDLRKPIIHDIFNLNNSVGLVPLLAQINENPDYAERTPNDTQTIILARHQIQVSSISNLQVMTSGLAGTEVSANMLGFQNLQRALNAIQSEFDFDAVIIDTPPAQLMADSHVIAASVKPNVILIAAIGHTNREELIKIKDQFVQVGSTVSGTILNSV